METTLIRNATLVNEGAVYQADVLIRGQRIEAIGTDLPRTADREIDATGLLLLPGAIDDQVHFREPGLTHKGEIATESKAAAAGGVTSYMEMPNTNPQTLTQELLQAKFDRAAEVSWVNYSFFMGASNDNLAEVLKTDPKTVCGIKIFMGSSTGNMLVDNDAVLEAIFSQVPMLIATHCEDEASVRANLAKAKEQYGDDIPVWMHPVIRDAEACYASSSKAVALARKHNTRLHILHISTEKELALFEPGNNPNKRITSEACVHHLWFSDADYERLGVRIKWNPAVKFASDREAIRVAVRDGRIDVIATDHAPHTLEEKANPYGSCPSGGPLVQHSVVAMLELVRQGVFDLPLVAEKMSHNVARLFQIRERGFIREGYFADLVLVETAPDGGAPFPADALHYKCGWSPFDGYGFHARIHTTFVNGQAVYQQGQFGQQAGMRLAFER